MKIEKIEIPKKEFNEHMIYIFFKWSVHSVTMVRPIISTYIVRDRNLIENFVCVVLDC